MNARRVAAAVGALAMLAGCTTDEPARDAEPPVLVSVSESRDLLTIRTATGVHHSVLLTHSCNPIDLPGITIRVRGGKECAR